MIEETAQVVATGPDGVWVETRRQSACGQCAANKGCGTAVLGKVLGQKRSWMRVANPGNTPVRVGDEVVIGIDESALVRGSLAIYLVPLLSFFIFGVLGETLTRQLAMAGGEALSMLFAVAGLFLGFLWARRYTRGDRRYQPVIVANATPSVSFYNTH